MRKVNAEYDLTIKAWLFCLN